MTIDISSRDAIIKLLAFLAVQSKGRFRVREELLEDVYASVRQFARDNRVRVALIQPDSDRVQRFGWTGATAGGLIGYALGAMPGAVTGMAVGGGLGLAAAHMKITVIRQERDGTVIFDLF